MFYVLWFVLGAVVGSFLNVLIYRLPRQEQFVRGRSFCPNCKKNLKAKDLIPLISFISLKGRCRYCQKKISVQYPLIEFVTGILFVFLAYYYQIGADWGNILFWRNLIIVSGLVVVFMTDLKHFLLFDVVTWFLIFVAVISNFVLAIMSPSWQDGLENFILAGVIGCLFFWSQRALSRGLWVGQGDIYLGLLMGLLLGIKGLIVALFFAYVLGAIISLYLLVMKKKKMKSQLPFGVFLTLGIFIALFWGEKILTWYLNLLS